jgi:hypothetical protein
MDIIALLVVLSCTLFVFLIAAYRASRYLDRERWEKHGPTFWYFRRPGWPDFRPEGRSWLIIAFSSGASFGAIIVILAWARVWRLLF